MDKEEEGCGFHPAALVSIRPTTKKTILAVEDENAFGGGASSSSGKAILANGQSVADNEELEYNPELEFGCGTCGEDTLSKPLKTPFKPTQRMISDHNISHLPFRAWCAACVRGRGKSNKHSLQDKSEDLYPAISIDYGFFGTKEQVKDKEIGSSKLPILVVKDRKSKMIWAHPVPAKGTEDPYAFNCLVRDLDDTGYKRIILKDDQEPAVKAVGIAAKIKWKGEVVPEQSPKRESKSNGEIERAVQEVQGMARTLKEATEQKLGIELDAKMAILAWLVEYGATLYSLFQRGEDGMTPIQRLKGRAWKIELPEFAEMIEFMKRTRHKLSARWEEGVYLGIKIRTSEKIVGTSEGIFVVQSVRRKPLQDRWNADKVSKLWGVPWKLTQAEENGQTEIIELPYPIEIEPEMSEVPNVMAEAHEGTKNIRRTYLTKKDLQTHGYTKGCPACGAISGGFDRSGVVHNDECRKRLEGKLKEDPVGNERIQKTEQKANERIAEELERSDKRDRGEDVSLEEGKRRRAESSGPKGEKREIENDEDRRKRKKERKKTKDRKRKAEEQKGPGR